MSYLIATKGLPTERQPSKRHAQIRLFSHQTGCTPDLYRKAFRGLSKLVAECEKA